MENTKKPGKRYTRKELLAHGWTNSLIDRFLTQHGKGKYAYFRASEVAEIEHSPTFQTALHEYHEYLAQRQRIGNTPDAARKTAAICFASMLTQKVYELTLNEHKQVLVNLWHTSFIKHLCDTVETSHKTPDQLYDDLCNKNMEHYRRRFFRTADRAWIMYGHPLAEKFAEEYAQLLVRIAQSELATLRTHDIDANPAIFLGAPGFLENYPEQQSLFYSYLMFFAAHMIPQDLVYILSNKNCF